MLRIAIAVWAGLVFVTGCDAPVVPPGEDAGQMDAGGSECTSDSDCDDDVFCNGAERCDAPATGADARGCAPASADACMPTQECDEATDACLTMCDVEVDADGDGVDSTECGGLDCDDADANRYPGNTEICDAAQHDEDCDPATFGFRDGDGDARGDQRCCNVDAAGAETCGPDCDDSRPDVHPGEAESCDETDNDCDGAVDETVLRTFYVDADDDGYGDDSMPTVMACLPGANQSEMDGDCDDSTSAVSPVSPEICDVEGVDENCDDMANPASLCSCTGDVSRACSLPGRCAAGTERCVSGSWGACSIAAIAEVCNAEDDDCDGHTDESLTVVCFQDGDDDGYPEPGATMRDACPVSDRGSVGGCPFGSTNREPLGAAIDCNDGAFDVRPGATEICDGTMVDENCDGMANPNPPCACSGSETRACALPGRCAAGLETCSAGAWGACSISAIAETCNGVDDDCDGTVDDGVTIVCYSDGDDDTYSPGGPSSAECAAPGRGAVGGCPVGLTHRAPAAASVDCDDAAPTVFPGAPELCDAAMVDESCDGMANPNPPCACSGSETRACPLPGRCGTGIQTCASGAWGACSISPETESCNAIDDNCNGTVDEGTTVVCYTDGDNDTYSPGGAPSSVCPVPGRASVGGCPVGLTNRVPGTGTTDCNDASSIRYPGAPETCDGSFDDDCDMLVNEGCTCSTSDPQRPCMRSGVCATGTETCALPGPAWVCSVSAVPETCNMLDDDCDGVVDDGVQISCWTDGDSDGFAPMGAAISYACGACPVGTTMRNPATAPNQDCNDASASRYPGATEQCNLADDDCDGAIDDGLAQVTVYFDTDGDGRAGAPMMRCAGYPGSEPSSTDCNESSTQVYVGAPELCDRIDNNCSSGGLVDAAEDADGDDYAPVGGACTGGPLPETDCRDSDAMSYPGAVERCDGFDNDCDGLSDEEPAATATCAASHGYAECVAGDCRVLTCDAGYSDCDGSYANGCETSLSTSSLHCGGCGNACALGGACVASQCAEITSIGAGSAHACALRGGQVHCWGDNGAGQLGNGTTTDSVAPVVVTGITNATRIAVGQQHVCALRSDDTVVCWGDNANGQLGIGSTSPASSSSPMQVVGPTSGFLTDVSQITAGGGYTCAVRTVAPFVVCWGMNSSGQLGTGSTTQRTRPTTVLGVSPTAALDGVTSIDAGHYHTCARRTSSPYVVCWGTNNYGALGDGTNLARTRPVAVGLGTVASGAIEVAVGENHSCSRHGDGTVRCWGYDGGGELGNGSPASGSLTPVQVLLIDDATDIGAGSHGTCVSRADRSLWCWGDGYAGQIGDGFSTDRLSPVASGTYDAVVGGTSASLAGGFYFMCALRTSGQIGCWGLNEAGQLGDGSTTNRVRQVTVSGLGGFTELSAGLAHTCARRDSGRVACWGSDTQEALGNGPNTESSVRPIGQVNLQDVVQLATGEQTTCGRRASGSVWCWGENGHGELGNGTWRVAEDSASGVTGIGDAIDVGGGIDHMCAVRATGAVSCWGDNSQGQLGNGTVVEALTPVVATGITSAVEVVGGALHTCARTRTGEVMCWGDDAFGQLGDGATLADSLVPVAVTGITSAVDLVAGLDHTCALLATGEVRCWGADAGQQLGNGPVSTAQATPVTVTGTTMSIGDIVELYASGLHTCGRRASGAAVCWGTNDDGELGVGDTTLRDVPTAITAFADARGGAVGPDHTCFLRTGGMISCAGSDAGGQLGDADGSTADEPTPVPVALMP